jgi:hypothetical protein
VVAVVVSVFGVSGFAALVSHKLVEFVLGGRSSHGGKGLGWRGLRAVFVYEAGGVLECRGERVRCWDERWSSKLTGLGVLQGWAHAIFDEQAAFQQLRLDYPPWGMPDVAPSLGRESVLQGRSMLPGRFRAEVRRDDGQQHATERPRIVETGEPACRGGETGARVRNEGAADRRNGTAAAGVVVKAR